MDHPALVVLFDPLSNVTRGERKALLGVATFGIAVVKTGLIPTQIAALGITFNAPEQRVLLHLLGYVVLYFWVTFVVYAVGDYLAWQARYQLSRAVADHESEREQLEALNSMRRSPLLQPSPIELPDQSLRDRLAFLRTHLMTREVRLRFVLDSVLPVALGFIAMWLLFTTTPPVPTVPLFKAPTVDSRPPTL